MHLIQWMQIQKRFQTLDLSYFNSRRYFCHDGLQNYLIFKPIFNTFAKQTDDTETVIAWKVEILSDESIRPATAPGNSLAPKLKRINSSEIAVENKGSYLEQNKATFIFKNVVTFLIVCQQETWSGNLETKFKLSGDSLFVAVKLIWIQQLW